MPTILDLQGRVAVRAEANDEIGRLRWLLETSDKDVVNVSEGILEVAIVDPAVPFGFLLTVQDALHNFCSKYALAGSVLSFNTGVLVVGPSVAARREAHIDYLREKLASINMELHRLLLEDSGTHDANSQKGNSKL